MILINLGPPFSHMPFCKSYFCLQSEVEDTLKRIQSHRGVQGLIVINSEGEQFACSILSPFVVSRDVK